MATMRSLGDKKTQRYNISSRNNDIRVHNVLYSIMLYYVM